jgi:hypothetical protein
MPRIISKNATIPVGYTKPVILGSNKSASTLAFNASETYQ